ncbi:MAG: ECF-type sigma factor, partial [Bacteroidota bacterium]
ATVDVILPLVYDELQGLARRQLRRERSDHTLDTSALVHEAYLKLVRQDHVDWQNRAHFFGIASLAMRRILVNYAEARRAQKRGGDAVAVTYHDGEVGRTARIEELLDLDEALTRLAAHSERAARVVEMWFFGGLQHTEIAEALGISEPTVRRDWRMARAWLSTVLRDDPDTA